MQGAALNRDHGGHTRYLLRTNNEMWDETHAMNVPEIAAEEVQRRQVSKQASGGTAPPTMTPAQTTWLSGTTPALEAQRSIGAIAHQQMATRQGIVRLRLAEVSKPLNCDQCVA